LAQWVTTFRAKIVDCNVQLLARRQHLCAAPFKPSWFKGTKTFKTDGFHD
jgi:hypothetical protein